MYEVNQAGDYRCECGVRFNYSEVADYQGPAPVALAVEGAVVGRKVLEVRELSCMDDPVDGFSLNYRCPQMKFISKKRQNSKKACLIFSILGVIFFGILSMPAFIIGVLSLRSSSRRDERKAVYLSMAFSVASILFWGVVYYKSI